MGNFFNTREKIKRIAQVWPLCDYHHRYLHEL